MKNKALPAVLLAALATGCGTMVREPAAPAPAGAASVEILDDAIVTARVREALARVPDLRQTKIDVDTRDARVILRGEIKSMALRKQAEAAARRTRGVRSVDNQLIITG